MTELSFTQENMPEPEEFQQMLSEAMAETSPVDSLLELVIELSKYERQYGMTSAEFIQRYQRGELGDDPDMIDWAGAYRLFQRLKRRVEVAFSTHPHHKHIPTGVEPAEPPDLSDVLREIDQYLYNTGAGERA